MKSILFLLSVSLLISCQTQVDKHIALTQFVSKDAIATFSIENIDAFTSQQDINELLTTNTQLNVFKNVNTALAYINTEYTKASVLVSFLDTGNTSKTYSIISKAKPLHVISTDSSSTSVFTYNSKSFKKVEQNNHTFYKVSLDSILFISNSKIVIENTIRDFKALKTNNNTTTNTLIKTTQSNLSLILNTEDASAVFGNYFNISEQMSLQNLSDNIAFDVLISQKSIKADGITQINDSIPKLINLFKNTQAQTHNISLYTPLTAKGFTSYTYDDYEQLRENLKTFHIKHKALPTINQELFNTVNEIGLIYNDTGTTLFLNSLDVNLSNDALLRHNTLIETFRDIPIYSFEDSALFYEAYSPLINSKKISVYATLDNVFLFSENTEALKTIIANTQNKSVLGHQDFYQDIMSSLSDESSILHLINTDNLNTNLKYKDHKLAAIQFVAERNFAHVHTIIEKAGAQSTSKGISQIGSTKLDYPLVGAPQFFKNHINGTQDILVRDNTHQLYLISNTGTIRWKKQFENAILGAIQPIDVYKNGKIQLAFTTQDKFYVIDRNGNTIDGFPISFSKPITQPLAVFDYDNNRNYRFIVTQGNEVKMYNKKANIVSGFKFSKTKSNITNTPKHIRIGSRDYILIQTDAGKLNILSRTGSNRIAINQTINTKTNTWYAYKNTFTTTNETGDLVQISEAGKLTKTPLGLSQDHNITATRKTLVTMSENTLTIKGKSIELDFGLYTEPIIFYINNKIYVSVTDTQAHKVYLFDSNGILRPNFPVYGNSVIDLKNIDSDTNLEFITKGEDNSLLIYKIN